MWLFFSGTVIIYLGWKEKNMFGGTRVGPIVNRPQIWSPRLSGGQRMSFPNLKKNLYTEMKYINNEVTHISDANSCDQNGEEKTIYYSSEIPVGNLKTLKMGSLSQVSSHQLKCIKKNAC